MSQPLRTVCLLYTSALGVVAATLAGAAVAADMPKRKPGLWEINMQMDGVPNMGPMQQCIDQNTDNLMQQQAKKGKTDCSVMDIKPSGNKVSIHTCLLYTSRCV